MWNQKTCFWVTTHSDIYHMHADVGPQQPEGFPHHKQRGGGDDITSVDAEQTLQRIHTNFMRLTLRVPMATAFDLVTICIYTMDVNEFYDHILGLIYSIENSLMRYDLGICIIFFKYIVWLL